MVKRNKDENGIKVQATWENNKLIFKDKDGKIIENVQVVSNKPFDYPNVCRILAILMRTKNSNNAQDKKNQSVSDWIYES